MSTTKIYDTISSDEFIGKSLQNSVYTRERQAVYLVNKIFYRIGVLIFVITCVAAILQNTRMIDVTTFLYPCLFHQLSGLYCPGCGGTRAVKALLEGHFISCFIYHPVVFYCFILYVVFMGSHTLEHIWKKWNNMQKKSPHKKLFVRGLEFKVIYVYLGILIILVQWMIKNIILLI